MRAVPQLATLRGVAWGKAELAGSAASGTTVTAFVPSFNIIIWLRDVSRTRCTISQCPQSTKKGPGETPYPERRLVAQPPDVRRHYHCSQRVPHLYQFKKCATLLRQPLDYIFIWFLARCFTMSPVKGASPPQLNCPPLVSWTQSQFPSALYAPFVLPRAFT